MRVYLNSIVVALLAVAFCTACAVTRSQTTSNGDIPTVTACQLVQDPERFHQKVVRVTGIFENEFERSYFYDLNCKKLRGAHPEIWAASHKSFVFEGDSDEAKKNKTISGFGRWSVTAVGRFVQGKDPARFGHMGCCRYQFEFIRIEKSEKLSDQQH